MIAFEKPETALLYDRRVAASRRDRMKLRAKVERWDEKMQSEGMEGLVVREEDVLKEIEKIEDVEEDKGIEGEYDGYDCRVEEDDKSKW